jgi:two-component system, sensor histidine kinase PdtaS
MRPRIIFVLLVAYFTTNAQNNPLVETKAKKNAEALRLLAEGILWKDSVKIADAYSTQGRMQHESGNYLQAAQLYLKSLKIWEKLNNPEKMGSLYSKLSTLELSLGHDEESLIYTKKALQVLKGLSAYVAQQRLAIAYSQMAHYFANSYKKNNPLLEKSKIFYDSTNYYYSLELNLFRKLKDTVGIADVKEAIAYWYLFHKNEKAIQYFEASLKTYLNLGYPDQIVRKNLNLANAYLTFNQPDKAYSYILQAQKYCTGDLPIDNTIKQGFANTLSFYHREKGNWKEAYENFEKVHQYTVDRLVIDHQGALSRLKLDYETEKKDKKIIGQNHELELQKKNIMLQQRFLWAVGLLLVLMLIVSYKLYRLYQKNKIISYRNAILLQEQNHRVKNNLQVVSSLLSLQANLLEDENAKQAVDESQLRIEAMTILHRQLYDNQDVLDKIDMESYITELTEIILQSYGIYDIENVYKITHKQLNADKAVFTGLLINELVSNACKYAFQQNEYCFLEIGLSEKMNTIYLTIKDNGKQEILFEDDSLEFKIKTQSFGMKLVNMMVLQLNGSIDYEYDGGSIFKVKFRP